jgi:acyl-CoA synthetase (AMP-forming)/AMP-acid ligase II
MPNFAAHILQSLAAHPQKELLRWPLQAQLVVNTGESLLHQISLLRGSIRALNLPSQSCCLLLQAPSPTLLAAMVALMAEGHIVVLPPAGAGMSFLRMFRKNQPSARVLLFNGAKGWLRVVLPLLGWKVNRIQTDKKRSLEPVETEKALDLPVEAIALITHSSGSTGLPKQIERSHKLLLAQHQCISAVFPAFDGQKDLSLFPNVLLHQLAVGCCSVVPKLNNWKLKNLVPQQLLQQIEAEQVNSLTANPYFFEKLLKEAQTKQFNQLQAVGIGGAPVSEDLLEAVQNLFPKAKVYVIYGATEAEPIAVRLYEGLTAIFGGYAVGKPVAGLQLRLANTQALLVAGNNVSAGEIEVQGPHVLGTPSGWHATGDFGYLLNDELFLTARAGNHQVLGFVQHYVLEKTIQHMCAVKKVAAVVHTNGFAVYYTGTANPIEIQAFLAKHFKQVPIRSIRHIQKMPMDKRHFSKILYSHFTHGD